MWKYILGAGAILLLAAKKAMANCNPVAPGQPLQPCNKKTQADIAPTDLGWSGGQASGEASTAAGCGKIPPVTPPPGTRAWCQDNGQWFAVGTDVSSILNFISPVYSLKAGKWILTNSPGVNGQDPISTFAFNRYGPM